MSYEIKVLLCWVAFFAAVLFALFLYNMIHKYKFRKWQKNLVMHGDILECDVDEFVRVSKDVPGILSGLHINDEQSLFEFVCNIENYGYEAGMIILALMADQYRDYMSPLTLRFADKVLNLINMDKSKLAHWDMSLQQISMVDSFASGFAGFLLYLPPELEKNTMNPMHKYELKQQKEEAKTMKRLQKQHCRY